MSIKLNGVRVRPAIVAPEPSPPTDSLGAWYRADDINQSNGSTVFTWTDRSGNGVDLVPVPSVSQPTLSTSSPEFNSRKAISFNGSQQLYRLTPPNWSTGSSAFSIYVVNDPTFSTDLLGLVGWGQEGSTNGRVCFCYYGPAPHVIGVDGYGNASKKYVANSNAQISAAFSASGANMSSAEILINGSTGTLASSGDAVPWNIPNPCPELRIGGFAQASYGPFVGKIAEILIYHKQHASTERTDTLNYLSNRYGISLV